MYGAPTEGVDFCMDKSAFIVGPPYMVAELVGATCGRPQKPVKHF